LRKREGDREWEKKRKRRRGSQGNREGQEKTEKNGNLKEWFEQPYAKKCIYGYM